MESYLEHEDMFVIRKAQWAFWSLEKSRPTHSFF